MVYPPKLIYSQNIAVLQWQHLLNPVLTSLEEAACAFIYTKTRRYSPGGAQIPRKHITAAEGESINADLKLN